MAVTAAVSALIGGGVWIIPNLLNPVPYSELERYLAVEDWKGADWTTDRIFEQITPISNGNLTPEDIRCSQLDKIDTFWTKYSEGKFGLRVQKQIWLKMGKNFSKFRKQVGWRDANGNPTTKTHTLSAPDGHLPSVDYLKHEGTSKNSQDTYQINP